MSLFGFWVVSCSITKKTKRYRHNQHLVLCQQTKAVLRCENRGYGDSRQQNVSENCSLGWDMLLRKWSHITITTATAAAATATPTATATAAAAAAAAAITSTTTVTKNDR